MTRLAEGEHSAFDEVFEILWPVLKNYCQRILKNTAQAEDAAQRALLKIFERASDYDAKQAALAWALSFAFWECRTESTKEKRKRLEEKDVSEVQGTEDSPEELLARQEWQFFAEQLITSLTPEEKAVLLPPAEEELARLLPGVQPASLRKRRQRLVARLRSAWRMIVYPERGGENEQ